MLYGHLWLDLLSFLISFLVGDRLWYLVSPQADSEDETHACSGVQCRMNMCRSQ